MDRQSVDSNILRSVGYDAARETLEIEFASGRVYQYYDVPADVHQWLMRVPSKGGFFARKIRDVYSYKDVTWVLTVEQRPLIELLQESLDQPKRS